MTSITGIQCKISPLRVSRALIAEDSVQYRAGQAVLSRWPAACGSQARLAGQRPGEYLDAAR